MAEVEAFGRRDAADEGERDECEPSCDPPHRRNAIAGFAARASAPAPGGRQSPSPAFGPRAAGVLGGVRVTPRSPPMNSKKPVPSPAPQPSKTSVSAPRFRLQKLEERIAPKGAPFTRKCRPSW
jgi:hypothetical protein